MVIPPTIEVANLGMADSLILMVMALVVFGPRRLPQIGRQIGKLMYEFRKASNDFKFKKEEEERQRQLAANPPAQIEAGAATETPATETTHPYGSTYDEVAEARANAASEVPTIKPPSTGEPVPAAKSEPDTQPDTPTEVVEEAPSAASVAVAEQIPAANESAPIENAAEVTNSTTEPAHNG
jgi:sec-independent protein translocase protein TatB